MQLFQCDHCLNPAYFDNTRCSHCGHHLGFEPENLKILSLSQEDEGVFTAIATSKKYRYCANNHHNVCNWIVPYHHSSRFCLACSLNRTIPNLSRSSFLERWKVIEAAKHRLVYALLRWNLPIKSKSEDPNNGLAFDFKSDEGAPNGQRVLTGHASGLITMNIAEADDVEREMAKNQMDEVYRTVLGHFRHEIGHYYWDILIRNSSQLESYRLIFGDERSSYQEALDKHYRLGAPKNWKEHYISPYASVHPWEDWAETWAHYLHMVDTMETAYSFGLTIQPKVSFPGDSMGTNMTVDAYNKTGFDEIFAQWLPLTFVMNSLNRSMGAKDLYPFFINNSVKEKLKFIHHVVNGYSRDGQGTQMKR
ncbi:MAG: putative zinc-binding peptidase [Cyclobacteriaceae bacterium]